MLMFSSYMFCFYRSSKFQEYVNLLSSIYFKHISFINVYRILNFLNMLEIIFTEKVSVIILIALKKMYIHIKINIIFISL